MDSVGNLRSETLSATMTFPLLLLEMREGGGMAN